MDRRAYKRGYKAGKAACAGTLKMLDDLPEETQANLLMRFATNNEALHSNRSVNQSYRYGFRDSVNQANAESAYVDAIAKAKV